MPTRLPLIAPTAWEHPADRAALNSLRALPGLDEAVRRVFGTIGERGVRQLFLANAVRVGPNQRPALDALYSDVLATLDWPGGEEALASRAGRPELYVTQTPFVNAAAVGFEHPFIIVSSSMLELLDEDEQRFILAHELGHVMSGHATYRTLAILLITFGRQGLPFLAHLALLPFQLALLEWYRKSELSADRAGLLGAQDPRAAMGTFLKLAGGAAAGDRVDLDDFMRQAAEYESDEGALDAIFRVINTAFRDHPFGTVRAAELQRWISSGEYDRILGGDYQRRGATNTTGDAAAEGSIGGSTSQQRPLGDDLADAAKYYGEQLRTVANQVGDSLDRAADALADAFRRR